MGENIIPLGDIKKLEIAGVGGDLYLSGWNREEIRIKDLSSGDKFDEKKDRLILTFAGDGIIHLPYSLEAAIKTVGSDVHIRGIKGALKITTVGGDLSISEVGSLKADSIGGDLIAKQVQGDLRIENIGGNGLVDNLTGMISLSNLGGDLQLEKVSGGIDVNCGGEARLEFSPVPWQAYQITAGGDIAAAMPDDLSADFSLESAEQDITVILGDLKLKLKEKTHSRQIGEGGPSITLKAGGKLFISGGDYSWLENIRINAEELENIAVDFSSQAAEQIKSRLSHLEEDLRGSLSGLSDSLDSIGISEENLERIASQIEESSRQAAQKAELAAIKAQAKVEKKFAQFRKEARKAKSKAMEFDLDRFLSEHQKPQSVSADERLLILNMLQEKKITPEEADDLLKSLEGRRKS